MLNVIIFGCNRARRKLSNRKNARCDRWPFPLARVSELNVSTLGCTHA